MRRKMPLCVQYRCKSFMNIHNLWLGDSACTEPLVSGSAVQTGRLRQGSGSLATLESGYGAEGRREE